MTSHNDSELGLVPVRDHAPLWPWALAGLLIGTLSALALIAAIVPHNDPTGTPTLAEPK